MNGHAPLFTNNVKVAPVVAASAVVKRTRASIDRRLSTRSGRNNPLIQHSAVMPAGTAACTLYCRLL